MYLDMLYYKQMVRKAIGDRNRNKVKYLTNNVEYAIIHCIGYSNG